MHVHITQPTWIHALGFAGLHAIRYVNMAMAIVAYYQAFFALLFLRKESELLKKI